MPLPGGIRRGVQPPIRHPGGHYLREHDTGKPGGGVPEVLLSAKRRVPVQRRRSHAAGGSNHAAGLAGGLPAGCGNRSGRTGGGAEPMGTGVPGPGGAERLSGLSAGGAERYHPGSLDAAENGWYSGEDHAGQRLGGGGSHSYPFFLAAAGGSGDDTRAAGPVAGCAGTGRRSGGADNRAAEPDVLQAGGRCRSACGRCWTPPSC